MSELIDFDVLKSANLLPSPHGVKLNVMRLCQHEHVRLPELARQIQSDPVLTGRILKIANTANPNRSRPFAAVTTDTLILVGVQAVRQVVLAISLVQSYRSGRCSGFNHMQFWTRSLAMACAAQALAGQVRIVPEAEMFCCGLLAGIGRLGLASARPEAYAKLLLEGKGRPAQDQADAEYQCFGMHAQGLTAAMMTDWGIPLLFANAALFHEAPEQCGQALGSRPQRLTQILYVASQIAGLCMASDADRPDLLAAALLLGADLDLDLDPETMAVVINQTSAQWRDWGDELLLQTRALPPVSATGEASPG